MSTLQIATPRVFVPLLKPARYKGAYGGRGSGKSHFFAELLIETCLAKPMRFVCLREIQKSLKESVKLLLEDKIKKLGVSNSFNILNDRIDCPYGGRIIFQGMQDHTAESIKSLEGYDGAWFAEAQSASQKSLDLLRPTIRKEDSELWFDWNPSTEEDPIELLLRGHKPPKDLVIVESNWRDNPFFPDVLKQEMLEDKARDYEKYLHIWEGKYIKAVEGAVFKEELAQADTRITSVPLVEEKTVDLIFDLGDADGCAVWYKQYANLQHRFIDYHYESHKKIGWHIEEIQKRRYKIGTIWLPHDAEYELLGQEKTIKHQIEEAFPNAEIRVIEAAGKPGSLNTGINLARNIFNQCWFDKEKTKEGIRALRHWHYKKDETTGRTSLKPFHDWSSHGSMAFVYFAMSVEEIMPKIKRRNNATNWMG